MYMRHFHTYLTGTLLKHVNNKNSHASDHYGIFSISYSQVRIA